MELNDYYIPQKLNKYNYDIYTTRVEILHFIKSNKQNFKGKVLDVGCGNKPYEKIITSNELVSEYIGMDLDGSKIYNAVSKDLIWDGNTIPLTDNSIETILATELLEHCYDTKKILKEIYRVVVKNGTFIGTVPFIWPLHETPNDFYRFTPFSLKALLEESGFKDVQITPFGGNNKMLAVSLALWLKNNKGSRLKKYILRTIGLFLIKILNKKDKPNNNVFEENNTFIGLGFVAKK